MMQANQVEAGGARGGYVWATTAIGGSVQLVQITERGAEVRLTFMPGILAASATAQELALRVNEIIPKRRSEVGRLWGERSERLWRGLAPAVFHRPVDERLAVAMACEDAEAMAALVQESGLSGRSKGFCAPTPDDHVACFAPILAALDEWSTVGGDDAMLCLTVDGRPLFPNRVGPVDVVRSEFDQWRWKLIAAAGR